jgi:hypothetical protein
VSRKTILDTIGQTPIVELVRMNPNPAVRLFVLLPDRGDRYVTTALYCNERCRTVKCSVEHCRKCPGLHVE